MISGATYSGVPQNVHVFFPKPIFLAKPKSTYGLKNRQENRNQFIFIWFLTLIPVSLSQRTEPPLTARQPEALQLVAALPKSTQSTQEPRGWVGGWGGVDGSAPKTTELGLPQVYLYNALNTLLFSHLMPFKCQRIPSLPPQREQSAVHRFPS